MIKEINYYVKTDSPSLSISKYDYRIFVSDDPGGESKDHNGEKISYIHGLAVDLLTTECSVLPHILSFSGDDRERNVHLGNDRSDYVGFSISADGKTLCSNGNDDLHISIWETSIHRFPKLSRIDLVPINMHRKRFL